MRLNCDIVVQNWSCSSQGVGGLRKPARASVSVGRKPCSTVNKNQTSAQETAFLLLCTAKNATGMKYKIIGNISNVFARFLENGKATIRFKEPPHDLCISKADPQSLRKLLATLKLAAKDLQKLNLPHLNQPKASEIQSVKTTLTINTRSDYPTSTSFPSTLTKLTAVNCGMVCVDLRILALRCLVTLDLSNNRLKKLDVSFDRLKFLKVLNLSSNRITMLPSNLCRTCSLQSLDLTKNSLTCLPISFARMDSLVNVKLDNNMLSSLPCNIGDLSMLRFLSVSGNHLKTLPNSVLYLNLDSLDVSRNPFLESDFWYHIIKLSQPSLQEFAARKVRKSRAHYDHKMVGQYLCDYLDSGKLCCKCNGYCFDSIVYALAEGNPGESARTFLSSGKRYLPYEFYYCSNSCFTG